jgi:outer membrane receptor for ferrienterochelin and colicins
MSGKPVGALASVLVLCAGLAAARPEAAAQPGGEPARLTVQVKDNWGVIPSATVRAVNRDTKAVSRRVSDAGGRAVFEGLAAGTYDVTAGLEGFADSTARVTIAAAAAETVTVVLSQVQFSDTITVSTPARREEILLDVADPVTLIEKAQIQDTGARTAKDLLIDQGGAGIQVNAGGGQGHVSINGIPNSGVLVLQDGRRFLGKDANGNLNLEDLEMSGVDRVEVVKGAGSALYGSDALGGVVNVITRRSPPGFSNTLQLTGGSYADYHATDTFGYRREPGGFSAGLGYRTYDGFDLNPADPQTIGQPESKWKTFTFNGDIRPAQWLLVRGFGNYQNRKIDNYFFRGATQLGGVYNSKRDLTRYMFAPDADLLLGADTAVTLSGTYAKYDREETQVYPTAERVQVPWLEWNKEFRATGRRTWRAMGQVQYLQAGYEFRREILDRASLLAPDGGSGSQSRDINVFWLQQEFVLGRQLRVTGGFRYDSYERYGHRWSPKVTAVYALTDRHRARFTYGQGFRAPYFGELYLSMPPVFVGNPNLRPEESSSFTIGYAYGGRTAQVSADYFHNKVTNGITFDLSTLPYTYVNLRNYTSQGLDTTASVNLPYGFVPSFSYAYLHREDADGAPVGGVPPHALYFKLLWASPRYGLRANIRAQYSSDVQFDDGTFQPAYRVWRGQVSKRFAAAAGAYAFTVFAQVDNIFDKRDIFRRGIDGQPIPGDFQVWIPPRTFLVGLTVDMSFGK